VISGLHRDDPSERRLENKKGPEIHSGFQGLGSLGVLCSLTRFLPGNPGRIPKPKPIKSAAERGRATGQVLVGGLHEFERRFSRRTIKLRAGPGGVNAKDWPGRPEPRPSRNAHPANPRNRWRIHGGTMNTITTSTSHAQIRPVGHAERPFQGRRPHPSCWVLRRKRARIMDSPPAPCFLVPLPLTILQAAS